jgi:micrococcal nuclease
LYKYNAVCTRVIDGDTIDAEVDLGFKVWIKVRIRLSGIDAPETRTRDLTEKQLGFETKRRLEQILEQVDNKFVLISDKVDKYGRCLGTSYINNENINQKLLNEGLAEVYK